MDRYVTVRANAPKRHGFERFFSIALVFTWIFILDQTKTQQQ